MNREIRSHINTGCNIEKSRFDLMEVVRQQNYYSVRVSFSLFLFLFLAVAGFFALFRRSIELWTVDFFFGRFWRLNLFRKAYNKQMTQNCPETLALDRLT